MCNVTSMLTRVRREARKRPLVRGQLTQSLVGWTDLEGQKQQMQRNPLTRKFPKEPNTTSRAPSPFPSAPAAAEHVSQALYL